MNNDGGREFLKFVSGLLDFIAQYDKAQLSAFRAMSVKRFHNVGNIIQDMLELMEGPNTEIPGSLKTKKVEEIPKLGKTEGKLRALLSSKEYLKQTRDVVAFADRSLGIQVKQGHRIRVDIINRIIREFEKKSDQERIKIGKLLDQVGKHLEEAESIDFFSGWEKVIKSIEL